MTYKKSTERRTKESEWAEEEMQVLSWVPRYVDGC